MELQGGKPKTIPVAIPKVIAYIYKNLKDICDSVLCIYHKWLCTLFRCASLWDRALSPINISLILCLGGPLFLSVTSSPSQASERRWFQLGQFPQHTGGCFPALVHRCPQWGGVRHPRVVQLIWSKPSITTWFCGSRVCFSMSVLHTQSLKLKQILYWLHDGWWCFLRSYKPLAPLQTLGVLVCSQAARLELRWACGSTAPCLASARNATGGSSTCFNGLVKEPVCRDAFIFIPCQSADNFFLFSRVLVSKIVACGLPLRHHSLIPSPSWYFFGHVSPISYMLGSGLCQTFVSAFCFLIFQLLFLAFVPI